MQQLPKALGRSEGRTAGFSDELNEAIEALGCSASELAARAGLSKSTLSRYRSGARTPAADDESVKALVCAMAGLAAERGIAGLDAESLSSRFVSALTDANPCFDHELLRDRFAALVDALELSAASLAPALNYDPSTISRILAGRRRTGDPGAFIAALAGHISKEAPHMAGPARATLARLVGEGAVSDDARCRYEAVLTWLAERQDLEGAAAFSFVKELDSLDFNEFLRSVDYDRLVAPTSPFRIPSRRSCVGQEEFAKAEIDFLRSTVLSRSKDPVFIYSDFPMEGISVDSEFFRKWAGGVLYVLRKGLHIDMLHCMDRPLDELLVGIRGWMPAYMTGQVTGYYLENAESSFHNAIMVSGGGCLTGSAVAGRHAEVQGMLSKRGSDIGRVRSSADALIARAKPLFEAFRSEDAKGFAALLDGEAKRSGRVRILASAPPVSAVCHGEDPALLDRILAEAGASESLAAKVRAYAEQEGRWLEAFAGNGGLLLEMAVLGRDEFAQRPARLGLSGMFCEADLPYSYESYLEHVGALERLAQALPGLELRWVKNMPFRNLQLCLREGSWAIVSRGMAPTVHFVCRHPGVLDAMRQMLLRF